jgi:hypothetical protein
MIHYKEEREQTREEFLSSYFLLHKRIIEKCLFVTSHIEMHVGIHLTCKAAGTQNKSLHTEELRP